MQPAISSSMVDRVRVRVRRSVVGLATVGFVTAVLASGCGGPKYPTCENDEHCNSDGHSGVCVNGSCVGCRDDFGCSRGKACRDGACTAIEGFCDDKSPCPGGTPCREGRCAAAKLAAREPRECGDDLPCSSGQRCENGHCVSPPQGGPGCTTFSAPRFDFEGADVTGDARETLKRLAKCVTSGSLQSANVLLTGHCDSRGEDEFNMTLGAQRAESVKGFLQELGVPANRVSTSSRGKLDARGDDEATMAQDRRVDIEVR